MRGNFHPARFTYFNQIIQNFICEGLVKNASGAVALHIKFQAFKLDAFFIRTVFDGNLSEIRLAGLGAKACEFRASYRDAIVPLPFGIVKQFNLGLLIHIIEPLHKIS